MSKELVKEPVWVCWDCGMPYLTEKQKQQGGAITAHINICDVCGENKTVTHVRHWNYLQPNLAIKK